MTAEHKYEMTISLQIVEHTYGITFALQMRIFLHNQLMSIQSNANQVFLENLSPEAGSFQ